MTGSESGGRRIRADFSESTITVYQAYSPQIAAPALAQSRFVSPFRRNRMSWIKPSFLWMMYRSAWATRPGQERVLAIDIARAGFEWALHHSALSQFDPDVHGSRDEWLASLGEPVRIQWDPERDLLLRLIGRRTIQVGLGGEALDRYVDEWTVAIRDVTGLARTIRDLVEGGEETRAADLLPRERPYPLDDRSRRRIGASD